MGNSFKENIRPIEIIMFYGQFELDKIIYENFFKGKERGFFVECGALDGLMESTCKFFEETLKWKGLNIEPVPYTFNKLIQNRPNCINENCALSCQNKTANFTNAIHPDLGRQFGNGSLSHTFEHKQELENMGCKFETFQINCFKFSELYQKHNLSKIDLFVLDVEGHEIEALQGILEIPVEGYPSIFCIEYTFSGIEEIYKMLKPHYTLHSKYMHNAFFTKEI